MELSLDFNPVVGVAILVTPIWIIGVYFYFVLKFNRK